MKSETKNKYIIILSIIIICMLIFFIVNGIVQGGKNREYKNTITELETEIDRARRTNTELDGIITGLKKRQRGLEEIISRNGERIQRLESVTAKLRENNRSSIEIINEIEKLFSEVMDN